MLKLHKFSEEYIDKDLTNCKKEFDNALLYNCTLKDLRNVTIKNCDLNHTKIISDKIEELVGFAATFSCKHFKNVELSELVFDLFVMLLTQTKGNDKKREKLFDLLGKERVEFFNNKLKDIE